MFREFINQVEEHRKEMKAKIESECIDSVCYCCSAPSTLIMEVSCIGALIPVCQSCYEDLRAASTQRAVERRVEATSFLSRIDISGVDKASN